MNLNQSAIYRAGAGAGKTTQLIQQIQNYAFHFYQQNERWPRVIVTTFTRKATQELKERLILRAIQEISHSKHSQNPFDFLKDFILTRQIHISTIDGLLSLFLKQYAFETGYDPGFQIIESTNNKKWALNTLRHLIKKNAEFQKLFDHYSFSQMQSLCLYYLSSFYTFQNLKPPSTEDLIAMNIHKIKSLWQNLYCLDFYKNLNISSHLHQYFNNSDETQNQSYETLLDSLKFINKNFDSLKAHKDTKKYFKIPAFKDWKSFFEKEHLYQTKYLKQYAEYFSLFDHLAQQFVLVFESVKQAHGLMSIRDLEFVILKILKNHPNTIQSFSKEWDYWLIDEYQDTTPIQAKILNHLKGSSQEFIVGDPQQSIYLFRGARSEVFEDKQKSIQNTQKLDTNYRAQPSLVCFFNDFFQNMQSPFAVIKPKSLDFQTIHPVALFTRYQDTQTFDTSKESSKYNIRHNKNEIHDQAVVAEVIELLNKGASYSDISIICRKNHHLSRIAKKLTQYSIPYHLFTSEKTPPKYIRSINNILKFILNPYNDLNLIEVLRSIWIRLSISDLHILMNEYQNKKLNSLWQTLLSLQNQDWESLKTKLKKWIQDADTLGITEALKKACISLGMIDFCKMYDGSGDLEAHIWKYFIQIQSEEQQPGFNYLKFTLDFLSPNDLQSDAVPSLQSHRLQLMTVHKSKGLEFQHVLIPHVNEAPEYTTTAKPFFVLEREGSQRDHLWGIGLKNKDDTKKHSLLGDLAVEEIKKREQMESDRLLYVAMTRAKKSVHLFCHSQKIAKDSWQDRSKCHLWIPPEIIGKQICTHYSYAIKDFDGQMPPLNIKQNAESQSTKEKLQLDLDHKTNIQRMSVTELLQEKKPSVELTKQKSNKYMLLKKVEKMHLGSAFHRLLQAFCLNPHFIEEKPQDIIEKHFSCYFQKNTHQQIIQSIVSLLSLEEPPIKQLLMKGYSEWSFLHYHHSEKQIIEGKIDLWGIIGDVLYIVDYKTGQKTDHQKERKQLRYYGEALAEKYPQQKIKLFIIYLDSHPLGIDSFDLR